MFLSISPLVTALPLAALFLVAVVLSVLLAAGCAAEVQRYTGGPGVWHLSSKYRGTYRMDRWWSNPPTTSSGNATGFAAMAPEDPERHLDDGLKAGELKPQLSLSPLSQQSVCSPCPTGQRRATGPTEGSG